MSAGFIYVLVNPTMPGLAKVGKTIRDTSQRVTELSSATGVPSPFVLVYVQPVANCHAAESWVHQVLESRGYRHAGNREFFSAPVHEIVRVVLESQEVGADQAHQEYACDLEDDSLSAGESLYRLAKDQMSGSDTSLPDARMGYHTLLKAADLGYPPAVGLMGAAFRHGADGVKRNDNEALKYLFQAAQAGQEWAFGEIGGSFWDAKRYETGNQYWVQFFESAARDFQIRGEIELNDRVGQLGAEYVKRAIVHKETPEVIPHDDIAAIKWPILMAINEELANVQHLNDEEYYDAVAPTLHAASEFLSRMKAAGESEYGYG